MEHSSTQSLCGAIKKACSSSVVIVLLVTSAIAQTTIYGSGTTAPTAIVGDPTSPTAFNAAPTYTKIYVVFPPQSSGDTNTHFVSYVMTQPSIDGVTLKVPWNLVETAVPTQTDCTSSRQPDECQPDSKATGWFHTYDRWSTIDGNGLCTDHSPNSSSQWFCAFGGVLKQVNFLLFGISDSPTNSITPAYVTSASWVAAASPGYLHEDVVNNINASGCGNYAGIIANAPALSTFTGDGAPTKSMINVTGWTSPPLEAVS